MNTNISFRHFVGTLLLVPMTAISLWGCALAGNTGTDSTTDPSSNGGSSTNSCTTTVADYGQKGSIAGTIRGSYSDLKTIPGTTYPATAFVDAGDVVLKLSWWDGSQFVTEAVSGDGAGAFVRLGFLSTGIPVVVWTQGANLKAAIRSAALSSSGTWSSAIIDTGVAPRAVEISISPLDQVGVVFLTDTATTGRPRFLYCDAPCTDPSGFQSMSVGTYVDNTAIVAAQVATGMAWCKASATQYYPAATYAVTGITRYAICQNTLANCLQTANWSTRQVVATGNVSTKLLLNPAVTGDEPKVVSLGAGGIVTYRMVGTACTAATAAFTAGATLGGATSGNQWIKLLIDSNNKFHVVANESTTSVRYYNSQTTDLNGAWNAAGTVDTISLGAATAAGADIAGSLSSVYLSYGTNASTYTLKIGKVTDYTVASNAATFSRYDVDVSGGMQLAGANAQQQILATAATSVGRPAVAYVDFSAGAATTGKLKYALRNGATATSIWDAMLVSTAVSPQYPYLAFDNNNKPWVSFFDASNNRFYMAYNSQTDGSASWVNYEFPAIPAGAPAALPAANQTAVAMYYSGSAANPVMIMIDNNAGSKGVKAAKLNTSTLAWSPVVTIDALTASGASHLTTDYDKSGNIVVAYRDNSTTRVKYTFSSDGGVTWSSPTSISAVNQGAGATVEINPTTGKPTAAFYDRANNALYYATCSNPIASSTAGWSSTLVDNTAGTSGLASGNEQLLTAGLRYDSAGNVYIIYARGAGSTGALMQAKAAAGSTSFTLTTLNPGASASLSGTVPLHFSVGGWNPSSVANAAGGLTTLFVGPGNRLNSISCGD
jgi:hypothetical protein